MISFGHKGNFDDLTKFLGKFKNGIDISLLDKYGQQGVNALSSATPVDTGLTSNSWYYKIKKSKNTVSLQFFNSNIQNGVPIAIILQHGHATRNGGWVQGRDYINPAIQPIFDELANSAWREVTK